LIRELSTRLNAAGIGSFKFNNRGHDVVTGLGKQFAGAAFQALRAERSAMPDPQAPRAAGLGLPERQALHQPVLPIAAIVGSRDEYLDRQPQELIDGFRRNASRSR